jgi:hypothetical protein
MKIHLMITFIYEIYINRLFIVDHFNIRINEIKMKHLYELNNLLIDELTDIVK